MEELTVYNTYHLSKGVFLCNQNSDFSVLIQKHGLRLLVQHLLLEVVLHASILFNLGLVA